MYIKKGRRVAVHHSVILNGRVCKYCPIEDTKGLVAAEVSEARAVDRDLRVASLWSANWIDADDLRNVIVQVLHGCRPHIFFESKSQVDIAWSLDSRRNALHFGCRNKLARDCCLPWDSGTFERAPDRPCVLEVGPSNNNFCSAFNGAFSRVYVKNQRRLVVVEDLVIVSVLYTVKCELNTGLMPVVGWRRDANCSRRVGHDRGNSYLKVKECAKRIVGVVYLVEHLFKREEVSTFQHDMGAAHFRTVVGDELLN